MADVASRLMTLLWVNGKVRGNCLFTINDLSKEFPEILEPTQNCGWHTRLLTSVHKAENVDKSL